MMCCFILRLRNDSDIIDMFVYLILMALLVSYHDSFISMCHHSNVFCVCFIHYQLVFLINIFMSFSLLYCL